MALAAAGTLQPDAVQAFVLETLPLTRSDVSAEGDGRYAVSRVSGELRQADVPGGRQVYRRYDLVTFDPAKIAVPGGPPPELLGPGHPLVDALAHRVAGASGDVLCRGVVLDDTAADESCMLLLLSCCA